jgi:hypothetical protein
MTNDNVSDLSQADTPWKPADALRGQVDAAAYKHVDTGSENEEGRKGLAHVIREQLGRIELA